MSGRVGADPESLDQLAGRLQDFRHALDSERTRLSSGVHERAWKGSRADRFRSDWDHRYVPWLVSACEWLDHQVDLLHRNANEQRIASGEQPKDYSTGWRSVLHRTERAVDSLERVGAWTLQKADDFGHRAIKDVSSELKDAAAGYREIVGSAAFDRVLDIVEMSSAVIGLAAIAVPALAPLAAGVALGTFACRVLQTINDPGKADWPAMFGDGLAVATLGLSGLAAESDKAAVVVVQKVGMDGPFVQNAREIDGVWKASTYENLLTKQGWTNVITAHSISTGVSDLYKAAQVGQVAVRVGEAANAFASTYQHVSSDVGAGDYVHAASDVALGAVSVGGALSGVEGGDRLAQGADTAQELSHLGDKWPGGRTW